MADTQQNPLAELAREARARLAQELQAYAEQMQRLEKSFQTSLEQLRERHQQSLEELRERQRQLEGAVYQQLEALEKFELPAPPPPAVDDTVEKVLGGVRNLITATLPDQVLEVLGDEAQHLGARAVVFDVRGRAAWGSSARGFGMLLTDKALHGLVIPLNQEGPFRRVFETGGHEDATPVMLRRNRNLLDRLKPLAGEPILLLPIRSAGSVSAIFYVDTGEKGKALPVEALKILAEFAGAQIDRLMALSGVVNPPAEVPAAVEPESEEAEVVAEVAPAPVSAAPAAVAEEPGPREPEPPEQPMSMAAAASVASASAAVEAEPVVEEPASLPVAPEPEVEAAAVEPPPPPAPEFEPVTEPTPVPEAVAAPAPVEVAPPAPAAFDLSQLSEADQKIHKDAKRFAKLLVSEIELYNKTKVADGRKNCDLYKRLKSDIDRSRQTFEKRFGKTVGKQFDYFHEEIVKTLAGGDAALLGPEYPGPTV